MGNLREEKRRLRLKTVLSWVKEAQNKGKLIEKERLIATICMEFGTSRRTALEYINTLVNAGTMQI
jgi:hypothetical protein